ncbi:MAG TPA: NAD(P)/FAD-dependent oxidoreductase [Nocardioidaceae bacterium]|nr:NAD(P)/FAD-dependent oxidoreductase [Nocardioidaceae bacterium]
MPDVAVAGGGPVGLATALYAVRAGLSVTVFEPRAGVIDKACGEGLMPGAVAALDHLGVAVDGIALRGIRYLGSGRTAAALFRDGTGRGVRRTTLHAALRSAVEAAGVPIVARPVGEVRQDEAGVTVDGEPARYLVAADGLHSPVRRRLGLDAPVAGARRYGLRGHVRTVPWTDLVEVHWAARSEAYVTPVEPDQVGVAVLTSERGGLEQHLQAFPVLRDRLDGLTWSAARGAGPLRQRSRRRVAGRVLLVGDASGYVDALTGEGLAIGFAQARAAVDAIALDRPDGYEKTWRQVTWRYELLTRGLLGAARRPPVRRALVPAAAALPAVFGAAVNELGRVR